ncbi:nectin-4-like isoform X4 [Takifugu rubripes]|uniref:nectin-4-like isoform X4 n=1 Tax=Takifugu rubripes TaxID=31033 RepID=UPI001145E074|nr:nectin-4-like isoform X4 [Takifugu rubripes]
MQPFLNPWKSYHKLQVRIFLGSLLFSSQLQVCVERTRRRPLMLLNLMYISLLPVSPAQRIVSPAVVTGYLRQNVSLPCKFIPGPTNDQINQVQWGFKENERNETIILVSNQELGIKIHDTFLKDKVAIKEQALIISHLEERDAGAYTCRISAFPGGSFGASIQLLVEGLSLQPGAASKSIHVDQQQFPLRTWFILTSRSNGLQMLHRPPVTNVPTRQLPRTSHTPRFWFCSSNPTPNKPIPE